MTDVQTLAPPEATASPCDPMATIHFLDTQLREIRADIETMNEKLNEAADEYELCDAFERVLGEINQTITSFQLKPRIRLYDCTITLQVTLEATDYDAAIVAAREAAKMIRRHGDNMGGLEYAIEEWDVGECIQQ